ETPVVRGEAVEAVAEWNAHGEEAVASHHAKRFRDGLRRMAQVLEELEHQDRARGIVGEGEGLGGFDAVHSGTGTHGASQEFHAPEVLAQVSQLLETRRVEGAELVNGSGRAKRFREDPDGSSDRAVHPGARAPIAAARRGWSWQAPSRRRAGRERPPGGGLRGAGGRGGGSRPRPSGGPTSAPRAAPHP